MNTLEQQYPFKHICRIEMDRSETGELILDEPQSRYQQRDTHALHRYGAGAFGHFGIPDIHAAGVYAICVNGDIRYIGQTSDLSTRFNQGYGRISPRNAYVGGQQTNCRMNQLILKAALADEQIDLHFFNCANLNQIEDELIKQISPAWNLAGIMTGQSNDS